MYAGGKVFISLWSSTKVEEKFRFSVAWVGQLDKCRRIPHTYWSYIPVFEDEQCKNWSRKSIKICSGLNIYLHAVSAEQDPQLLASPHMLINKLVE